MSTRAEGPGGRALIALLTYVGPLVRCLERYRWWARGLSAASPERASPAAQALRIEWPDGAWHASFWTEEALQKEMILHGLRDAVAARRYFVRVDQGWSDWDLDVSGGVWARARVKVATEDHGGQRRVLRVRCALQPSLPGRVAIIGGLAIGLAGLALQQPAIALAGASGALLASAVWLREGMSLSRTLYDTLQAVARRSRLRYAPPLQHHEARVS